MAIGLLFISRTEGYVDPMSYLFDLPSGSTTIVFAGAVYLLLSPRASRPQAPPEEILGGCRTLSGRPAIYLESGHFTHEPRCNLLR